jgi:hypothetical protein
MTAPANLDRHSELALRSSNLMRLAGWRLHLGAHGFRQLSEP